MKNFLSLFVICMFWALAAHAQKELATKYLTDINSAEALYNKKKYKESADAFSSAFAELGGKGRAADRYNASRSWAMAGNIDSAFDCLQRIAEKTYFDDVKRMNDESDFNSLHADNRWKPLVAMVAENKKNELPKNWFRAGSKPQSYTMNIDKGAGMKGGDVITIKSRDKMINGFGTVMQNFLSQKYLGERIKMTGYVKAKDVEEWAGLWLRVDGKKIGRSLAFDNMKDGKTDRAIKGTNDWKQYEIVLDVPDKATNIAFGALLVGTGQIWFDKIEFEVVSNKTATTGMDHFREPENLNVGAN